MNASPLSAVVGAILGAAMGAVIALTIGAILFPKNRAAYFAAAVGGALIGGLLGATIGPHLASGPWPQRFAPPRGIARNHGAPVYWGK